MASSYESTSETTNANRVSRVVLQPCTDGLRDVLCHYVPPHTFPNVIKQNKLNLPRLTAAQRDLILPRHGHYKGNYSDMDISLLYTLLRNISGIAPHSNGWNRDPDPSDRSISANIERIHLVRNCCVHSCDPFMSNSDFNSLCSTIRSVMVDLDAFLMNGNKYVKAVDFLRYESMDPENDLHYEEELRKQVEEDKTTRKLVVNLKRKFEESAEETKNLHGKVAKLTESSIPQNVREQYDIDIQKWREEDKIYYETHSFPSMMEKVRNQPCVTFVGVPGSGKSATAHHIALKLQEEGYEVVPVDEIKEIKQYCDTKNPQVFVIDDVLGVFGIDENNLKALTTFKQKITQPCMIKSRTLMTCREDVFNEALSYKLFLTKEETVIRLHSSVNALNDKDKKQILQKYGLNVDLMSSALLTSTSCMFPLLCKLFSKETKFQALGSKFFLNPVPCIIDELDHMQRHNKLNYATLVLCMLNENSLTKDILKDKKNEKFMEMKINTLENCEFESQTDTFKFVKALSAMEGTYTKQCGAQYTFIHDSMFEICAYHYGKQFPDQMLLYMSSSYIANFVKPQTSEPDMVNKVKEKRSDSQSIEEDESSDDSDENEESNDKNNDREESSDLCIRLLEDQYPLLAERLYRDIQNMELYDVFRNQVLKHPQVCQAFIGVLETKSYTELKDLFLSSQKNVDKIVSKQKCVLEDNEKRSGENGWDWDGAGRQGALVDQRWKRDDKGKRTYDEYTYNVKVISWVVCYGHYQILKYIVQQTEQHNEINELLEVTGNNPYQSTSGIYTCNKKESEYNKFLEEFRLLALSCFSGEVQTVRVLLPICKKAINGIGQIIKWDVPCFWFRCSPLTIVCSGEQALVKELVKAGADVNVLDNNGDTPLIFACMVGQTSLVEELVKAGADVNLQDRPGNTPLTAACKGGHVSIVEELVKAGADIDQWDDYGDTPLTAACYRGHICVMEELVKAGADVNLQRGGVSPMMPACIGGQMSMLKELLMAGADVNLEDDDGNTPLIYACQGGHLDVVEELLEAGADVNEQSLYESTPLIVACQKGDESIVKELMKAGADVNLQYRRGNTGNTPLIAACKEGHLGIVEELMKEGAYINQWDDHGNTPLTAACYRGHICVMKQLVKAGADVNPPSSRISPLIAACKGGQMSMLKELLVAGADVNLQVGDGNTPLIAACEKGHVSIVGELLKAGADVNLQDSQKNTSLIAACKGGHVSIVGELLKAGLMSIYRIVRRIHH